MNQFAVKPLLHDKREAEGLLRIALFSKDLKLVEEEGVIRTEKPTLADKRADLAEALRKRRRRGVVPVFVSTAWFLFSLALSIQAAFGLVGENATAHDLALGLLMGWLPVLVLSSIIDRNPLSAEDVRDKLNNLIRPVCKSLQDGPIVEEYIQTNCAGPDEIGMRQRVRDIVARIERLDGSDFFTEFAGQGRTRWHYGVAHPILSDLENVWIAEHGREWLRDENEARNKLVLGSTDRGLFWFDSRQSWHITSAVIIVAGECSGAFILSYYTPTIGLGCRSQGYLIFGLISLGLLILEFIVWRCTSEEVEEYQARQDSSGRRNTFDTIALGRMRAASVVVVNRTRSWLERPYERFEDTVTKWFPKMFSFTYIGNRQRRQQHLQRVVREQFQAMRHYNVRTWWNILVFIPVEVVNTAWLIKVVLSQTFGAYVNCYCQASPYSSGGGYIDLQMVLHSELKYVMWSWVSGTAISGAALVLSLAHIVTEWCLQSHLSTLDRDDAREGLQRTRAFRYYTHYARQPLRWCVLKVNSLWYIGSGRQQRTLLWTRERTFHYDAELERERAFSTFSQDTELDSLPPMAPEMAYGRPRSSTETESRQLLASPPMPNIVEPHFANDGSSARIRTYSDASERSSMELTRRPVATSFLEAGDGSLGPPTGGQTGGGDDDYLRPRLGHMRQTSDEYLDGRVNGRSS
jgi:hypothetical protein